MNNQLQQFLTWLVENKPEIFTKYNRNFQESTGDGFSLATNMNNQITHETFEMLCKIASDWYAMNVAA